jgi:hypothetical protein
MHEEAKEKRLLEEKKKTPKRSTKNVLNGRVNM